MLLFEGNLRLWELDLIQHDHGKHLLYSFAVFANSVICSCLPYLAWAILVYHSLGVDRISPLSEKSVISKLHC